MIVIDETKCLGCGICTTDCVAQNIQIVEGKARVIRNCLQCGHCVSICPAEAVSIPDYDMSDVEPIEAESFALDPDRLLRAIKARRSIRNYRPVPIEQEKLLKMAEAGRYTATAVNSQRCQFLFVQDELDKMKEFIWNNIEEHKDQMDENGRPVFGAYQAFNERRKQDPKDDFLFRNAPAVAMIACENQWDAGLAAENMEMMAAAMGLGFLYNGYLLRAVELTPALKEWLGIPEQKVCICMLLGYPEVKYQRTAPRKPARVIMK